jgi:hypothetical protein
MAALAGLAGPGFAQLPIAPADRDPPGRVKAGPDSSLPPSGSLENIKHSAGYLVGPVENGHGGFHLQVEPYCPQPGDILLYNYSCKMYALALWWVGTDAPSHAAIVFARPDGTPAILEVGPHSTFHMFTATCIVDVLPRLSGYPGCIMVRRPLCPLTPEQSAELTQFALAQNGKKFATGRLLLQATPFKCRSGLRHALFARTCLDRKRWICSENVVAAATVAGLMDPKVHFANCMYPRDLAYDEHYDLSGTYAVPVLWVADPHPCIEGNRVKVIPPPEEN